MPARRREHGRRGDRVGVERGRDVGEQGHDDAERRAKGHDRALGHVLKSASFEMLSTALPIIPMALPAPVRKRGRLLVGGLGPTFGDLDHLLEGPPERAGKARIACWGH